jgi:hypothetical protein
VLIKEAMDMVSHEGNRNTKYVSVCLYYNGVENLITCKWAYCQ